MLIAHLFDDQGMTPSALPHVMNRGPARQTIFKIIPMLNVPFYIVK